MDKIDNLDKKILSILSKNARIPFKDVAAECGVSRAAIHQRVQHLVEGGVITGSGFDVNAKSLGYSTCTYVGLNLERGSMYKDDVISDTGLALTATVSACTFFFLSFLPATAVLKVAPARKSMANNNSFFMLLQSFLLLAHLDKLNLKDQRRERLDLASLALLVTQVLGNVNLPH